jgi:hypothetical protein
VFYHLKYSWKWWVNYRNEQWKEDMYSEFKKMLHPEDFDIMVNNHVMN